jgi:hypothetical protein
LRDATKKSLADLDYDTVCAEIKALVQDGQLNKRYIGAAAKVVWEAQGFSYNTPKPARPSTIAAGSGSARRSPTTKPAKTNIHTPVGEVRPVSESRAKKAVMLFDDVKAVFSPKHLTRLQRVIYFKHGIMPTTDFLMRIRKQAEEKGCKSSKVFMFQNWLHENSKTNAAVDGATTPSPSPTEGRREADKDPIHRIKEAIRREDASWKPLADAWRKVLAKNALEETPV